MGNLTGILLGLVMFLFLVTIHEAGHFFGAKFSGIKVNEFSVGMGPSIFKKQGKETLYSLRALPIGGYVMMEGEESDSEDKRSYNNAKAWKRFLTIFAGPLINILFSVIVIFIIYLSIGYNSTTIKSFMEDSPAKKAGILEGDKIVKINGKKVSSYYDILEMIGNSEKNAEIEVVRNGIQKTFIVNQKESLGRKIIGIYPSLEKDLLGAFKNSIYTNIFLIKSMWKAITGLFSGAIGISQLSGPVGVIRQVGESAKMGFASFMMIGAYISLNLGFFNLLPIPALDGSKLVFILIEMLSGKRVNKKFEEKVTIIGFLFLLGLMLLVTIKDVINLF